MNKLRNLLYLLGLSVILILPGCSDPDDELTSIDYDRLFSPTELKAIIVSRTNIELTWNAVQKAESYTIEVFQNGDLDFEGTPIRTYTDVTTATYTIEKLDGETSYSVRLKAVGTSITESKWVSVTIKTSTEQIFISLDEANDLGATWVTLRWTEGEIATQIILTPVDADNNAIGESITHSVTDQEIADGVATVEGLTPETRYQAVLKNGEKTRGTLVFETPLNLEGATLVTTEDDLVTMISEAEENTVFALMPGTYEIENGKLSIVKSLSIKAAKPAEKPILQAVISLEAAASFELKDVILDGTGIGSEGANGDHAIQFNTVNITYGDITITGCEIRNYLKGLLYFNVAGTANSMTINNCIIYNIECNGGDFFDCRLGTPKTITFTNNTVYNSAVSRDFFRIDNASANFPGVAPVVTISNNTLDGVANNASRRLLYIRWTGNSVILSKNIISNSPNGTLKHSSSTITSSSSNNYYDAATMAGADTGSGITTLDPGFANVANGDFTLSNATLIYNVIGDPRWIE